MVSWRWLQHMGYRMYMMHRYFFRGNIGLFYGFEFNGHEQQSLTHFWQPRLCIWSLSGLRFCIEKCIGEDKVLEKLIFQVNLFLNHHESTTEVVKETHISPLEINVKPKNHPIKKEHHLNHPPLLLASTPWFSIGVLFCCLLVFSSHLKPWRIKPKKVLKKHLWCSWFSTATSSWCSISICIIYPSKASLK